MENKGPLQKINALGFCVKSKDWTVRWQNEECRIVCGHKLDEVCELNCREWSKSENALERDGATTFQSKTIDGHRYDVVVLQTSDETVSVLCPVDRMHSEIEDFCRSVGLTDREVEIMHLQLERISHKEMCERLFISEATLKTHINSLRRKFAESGVDNPALNIRKK